MKRQLVIFNLIVLGLVTLYTTHAKTTGTGETRTAKVSILANPSAFIIINGKNTELLIETWNKNEIEVIAEVNYRGKEKANVTAFLNNFEQEVKDNIFTSNQKIEIKSSLDTPNKVQIGSKYAGIIVSYNDEELNITYSIKVPMVNGMQVVNSYKNLEMMGSYQSNVEIQQYSGNFKGGNFKDLKVSMKYGTAIVDQVRKLSGEMYEEDFTASFVNDMELNAKYSKIKVKNLGKSNFINYETKMYLGSAEMISGEMKYGRLEIEQWVDQLNFDILYEVEIYGNEVNDIRFGQSKYGEYQFKKIRSVQLMDSYEDKLSTEITYSADIKAKYGNFEMGDLVKYFVLDSYETETTLTILDESTEIKLQGKYGTAWITTNGNPIVVDANIQYGKINYPIETMNRNIYIYENDKLEMKLSSKNTQSKPCMINVRGYEQKVDIK